MVVTRHRGGRRVARGIAWVALTLLLGFPARSSVAAPAAGGPAPGIEGRAWIFTRLAEADALLRRGRPRAAARLFQDVFADTQGTQWGILAELGLAWSVATSGDAEFGRALAQDARASAGAASATTDVVLGLLSSRIGDYTAAMAHLDMAAGATSDATGASVIRLAKAYVLFWSEDFERAVGAFESVAALDPAGSLSDDARYGAAWSRFRSGALRPALEDLATLVADAPPGHTFRSVSRRLVELDARAILAASTRGHRRDAVQSPEAQLARMLDADGFSRARSALRFIDPDRLGRTTALHAALDGSAAPAYGTVPAAEASFQARPNEPLTAVAPERDPRRRDLMRIGLALLVLVTLALSALRLTRWGARRRVALRDAPRARRGSGDRAAPDVGA